jgi:hypothetical protein
MYTNIVTVTVFSIPPSAKSVWWISAEKLKLLIEILNIILG